MGRSYAIACKKCRKAINLYKSPPSFANEAIDFMFYHGCYIYDSTFEIIFDEDWDNPDPEWDRYDFVKHMDLKAVEEICKDKDIFANCLKIKQLRKEIYNFE